MSYQMLNTLPCTKDDVKEIAAYSVSYVELLKSDDQEFEKFLRKNANEVNHYEMMADLYRKNPAFADSKWYRYEKRQIIRTYVNKLRSGKIMVNGLSLIHISSVEPQTEHFYLTIEIIILIPAASGISVHDIRMKPH